MILAYLMFYPSVLRKDILTSIKFRGQFLNYLKAKDKLYIKTIRPLTGDTIFFYLDISIADDIFQDVAKINTNDTVVLNIDYFQWRHAEKVDFKNIQVMAYSFGITKSEILAYTEYKEKLKTLNRLSYLKIFLLAFIGLVILDMIRNNLEHILEVMEGRLLTFEKFLNKHFNPVSSYPSEVQLYIRYLKNNEGIFESYQYRLTQMKPNSRYKSEYEIPSQLMIKESNFSAFVFIALCIIEAIIFIPRLKPENNKWIWVIAAFGILIILYSFLFVRQSKRFITLDGEGISTYNLEKIKWENIEMTLIRYSDNVKELVIKKENSDDPITVNLFGFKKSTSQIGHLIELYKIKSKI